MSVSSRTVDDGPTHLFPEPNDYVIAGLCEESFGPNDKKGSFQSPDYPYEYYANEDCLFFFEGKMKYWYFFIFIFCLVSVNIMIL